MDPWTDGEHAYAELQGSQGHLGGVSKLAEQAKAMGAPPHWFAYVQVDDVDAKTAEAAALGGKIYVPPMDIPTVGRFSVIADPQGASIALFKAANAYPDHDRTKHVEFNWQELATSDSAAALAFYSQLFGWTLQAEHDMGPMGKYLLCGLNGKQESGIFNKPPNMPASAWIYYVKVDDLDGAIAAAGANGGKLIHGPQAIPGGGRIAQLFDPQGAVFALVGN